MPAPMDVLGAPTYTNSEPYIAVIKPVLAIAEPVPEEPVLLFEEPELVQEFPTWRELRSMPRWERRMWKEKIAAYRSSLYE